MSTSRREFLKATAAAGGALSLGLGPAPARDARDAGPRPLKLLILGGTTFLGPHQIRCALERGHSVSTFTRGRTQPTFNKALFKEVEPLIGDREDDLEALEGRTWDAVIDNSGRQVEWARDSAQLLKDAAGVYLYTSSTGVYLPYLGTDITEDTEVRLEDPAGSGRGRPSYGVMKALSELEVRKAFGDERAVIVRPSYIVGPGDPTDRFPYWPVRLERGGEVLVPGHADDPVQFIDARDLTEWMIRLIEDRTAGTFNGAGPASPMGMHAFVYGVHATTSSKVSWVMVDDYDFLREHRVQAIIPWIMPVGDYVGSARVNSDRAVSSGLTFRPLATTATDTLRWWHSDAVTAERRAKAWTDPRGVSAANEARVIAAFKARERKH